MQLYPSFIKRLTLLLVLDLLILGGWIWNMQATPDISIVEILIVPVLIVINILLAIISSYIKRFKPFSTPLLLNSILAPTIFHWLFVLWFSYFDQVNFDLYKFQLQGKQYEVVLDERDNSYSICERGQGWSTEYKRGKYKKHSGYIELLDSTDNIFLYKNYIIGYPYTKDSIRVEHK